MSDANNSTDVEMKNNDDKPDDVTFFIKQRWSRGK